MAEFDASFACKLAELAEHAMDESQHAYANRRAAIYLSRVACEVATKALLESAGVPIKKIEQRRHDIPALLRDLADCEVNMEPYGEARWVSASVVGEECVDLGLGRIPILELIGAAGEGFSKFPNQIRYGEVVMDVNPSLLSRAALLFCQWALRHESRLRVRTSGVC